MRRSGRHIVAGLALMAASAGAGSGQESPPSGEAACPVHVVERGEALHMIADRYLGTQRLAWQVYQANRRAIGPDPDVIVPGLSLVIPCDGEAPALAGEVSDAAPETPAPVQAAAAIPAAPLVDAMPPPRLQVLTAAPYLPFVDSDRPDGGMITAMVRAAFGATPGPAAEINFVNDREAHLSVLLPRGVFALSFPWISPDCDAAPAPAAEAPAICRDHVASDSLYEQVTEFLARADSEWAGVLVADQLAGASICRPEGHPVADLHGIGLLPGRVDLVRKPAPEDCLRALDEGQVDIAMLDAALTRALVARVRLEHPLIVLETLTRIDRLRAVARRDDPAGRAAIDRLNRGLARIVDTGEWFGIVDRHLHGAER